MRSGVSRVECELNGEFMKIMKIELGRFDVNRVVFGDRTEMKDGVLRIDRDELKSYLLRDPNFSNMDIELASPGESTRIINVLDVVDARKKVGEGEVFPGFTGPVNCSGQGRVHVIDNVSIVETGQMEGIFGGIIDMTGPVSTYSPYGKLKNVVLVPAAARGITATDYAYSLKQATLRTSVYLGKTTLPLVPDSVESFDLACESAAEKERLPRVAYIWQVLSHYALRRVYYFGEASYSFYPFVMQPREAIEGALVSGHYDHSPGLKNYTYSMLRNPVISELCRRHGHDLVFAGIIVTNGPRSIAEKERNAAINARLARLALSCDGIIITKEGGGHTDFDLMRTARECERAGMRTVVIDMEQLGPEGEGDYPLVVFENEADAIVSMGNCEEHVEIPKVGKVIGGKGMRELGADASEGRRIPIWLVSGAISELGMNALRGEWY